MKTVFLSFGFFLLSGTAYAGTKPDLLCTNSKGLSYKVYYKSFTEINSYNGDRLVTSMDSMRTSMRGNMLYFIHEEGDIVAAFKISGKRAIGRINKDRVSCNL